MRITGTNLDASPRYRLSAKTDKVVEAVRARRAFGDHRGGIERESRRRQNGAAQTQ